MWTSTRPTLTVAERNVKIMLMLMLPSFIGRHFPTTNNKGGEKRDRDGGASKGRQRREGKSYILDFP